MPRYKKPNPTKLSFESHQCRRDAPKTKKAYYRLFEDLLSSPAYHELSDTAVAIYIDMLRKYGAPKDSNFNFTYTHDQSIKKRSKPTFYKAIHELNKHGFVDYDEYNKTSKKAHLYKLSSRWQHSCLGK